METTFVIDSNSEATHLLLNPRLPPEERRGLDELARAAPDLRAHVWIATSGTSGSLKLTALSKASLLASAAAVNRHLGATGNDVWCCVLPLFHVGGLGIHARASLTGGPVFSMDWQAGEFVPFCDERRVTLCSLVPAQVSDLVRERVTAPTSIRAIVVGGGALGPELYRQARDLGWPLLPSYGMTECCSQVATAALGSLMANDFPDLELLPHLQARTEPDGRLALAGASLLTGYALHDEEGKPRFVDPKVEGWFVSDDLGNLDDSDGRRVLRVVGRRGEIIKIGGESVDLARLDRILESVIREIVPTADAAVFAAPDPRLGLVIHLAATTSAKLISDAFNARVLPFARIRGVHVVEAIPRSSLGKILRDRLAAQIG
ncbi:MAG TPA: AMP-binding protein [Thermoanaerobaculia bacterium]|nr:AMP-binding protein [Thermoanaerobaculia bacterium]